MVEGKSDGRMGTWKRAKEETIRRGFAHWSCCRKMEIAPSSLRSLRVARQRLSESLNLQSATTVILPTEATSLSSSRARIASAVGRKTISRRFFGRFRSYSFHSQQRSATYLVEAMVKKSNPWLYNRKSFQPLLTAFFFPLCCNLFARMGNPAYVCLVTRRTVEKIGSHTVLHTHCGNNIPTRNATIRGGNDRVVVGYGVQLYGSSSNLPWVRLGTPKKAEVGRQAGRHAVVVLGAA
ncbi:hypothetical protein ALC57_12237 [Trachymyrmex cornetzi]|uniref:Uncharacterized protein n=1 Tax=Trachymyrmex cornetzi TaxID=471704 RepID=A0A151J180_9HYME|nr:hypothetical protein ALC57_12237 [Trachymyrmex cornetzi]